MQVKSIDKSTVFGLKLNSNRVLSNDFLNALRTSPLVKDIENIYPDAILNFRYLSNQAGALLEFNLGNGNKFALIGSSKQGVPVLESLKAKLSTYSLSGMEEILPDRTIDYLL